jgi:hypothetical protein
LWVQICPGPHHTWISTWTSVIECIDLCLGSCLMATQTTFEWLKSSFGARKQLPNTCPKSAGRFTFRSCMFSHNSYSDCAISPLVKEIMFEEKVRDIYWKRSAILWGGWGKFERLGRYEILGEKCNLSEQESRDMQLNRELEEDFTRLLCRCFAVLNTTLQPMVLPYHIPS